MFFIKMIWLIKCLFLFSGKYVWWYLEFTSDLKAGNNNIMISVLPLYSSFTFSA